MKEININDPHKIQKTDCIGTLLTWRLNSQSRHAGLDPASSALLDSRLRGNDESRVFIPWSKNN